MILTIRFAKSPSQYFPLAQASAAEHPSYKETKVGAQTVFEVSLRDEDVDLIEELVKLVGNWKSTKITANGKRIRHWDVELALVCRDNYECTMKKHWCVACGKWRDIRDRELAKQKVTRRDNVVELPVKLWPR